MLVIAAALKRDAHRLEGELFSRQVWRYPDVITVTTLTTLGRFLDWLPGLGMLSILGVWTFLLSIQALIPLVTTYLILRCKYRQAFAILGFSGQSSNWYFGWLLKLTLAISILIGLVCVSVFWLRPFVSPIAPGLGHVLYRLRDQSLLELSLVAAYALIVVFVMPLSEEVYFRGFLYSPFWRKFGRCGAMILISTLWSLMHYPSLPAMTVALFAGPILTYLYYRTQSLLPSVALHASFNAVGLLSRLLFLCSSL